MGFINEKQFINNQVFKYEDRLNSQYTKFLEKPPTYVTYYNINNITSTADNGFGNVESILGTKSPLKFKEIKDFPIYDIESLILDLSDEDEGLQTSLEGEGVILPNTIKPLPNDYFTISYLKEAFLFIVTEVKYDTIKSNNYYKIAFSVKSISESSIKNLNMQVDEKYTCVGRNIGTQDKCLIRDDELEYLKSIQSCIEELSVDYINLFYNKRYNSFLFTAEYGDKMYNRYATQFINNNKLFNSRDSFRSLMLGIEDESNDFSFLYDNSIYNAIEKKNIRKINECNYNYRNIVSQSSIFNHYGDRRVKSLTLSNAGVYKMVDETLINMIKNNDRVIVEDAISKIPTPLPSTLCNLTPLLDKLYDSTMPNMMIFASLIIDYMNDNIKSISTLDIDTIRENIMVDPSYLSFMYVPIIIYILSKYRSLYLQN